ncbi:MAG: restriction endonuclease subunit S [Sulfuricurvum sp.]|uniref:restriction endonuclease subunit S n=1 Tax=Sulfuricurvum sp. TaxID=2025608 RepID=UPI002733C4CD|nr:restriction endonuclease subunit S [Sulfuricurvum sp.]MDP2850289.1 restriction endonuclease subunit S [Sulfuricurvum sp.]
MSRYQPYPSYNDSGVEWLGEVPEHWKVFPIKRLSPVQRGASPRPIDNAKYFDDEGEYAWVRITDVSASNGLLTETIQQLSDLGSSLSVKIQPGSLFVSIAGSVGKPCIAGLKACIHDGFVYFPLLKIDPKYLYRIFEAGTCYLGLGKMGTQLNLNTETVGGIYIALPPEDELKNILSFLDIQTAKIDTLIAKQQRMIELLKEKRSALISHAVTKGLDSNVKMKDSGVEWLGEVPEHWEIKKMKHVIKKIESGTSVNASNEPASVTEFGVLKTSCVYTGQFDPNENKTVIPEEIMRLSCPLQENTLIVSRMNTPDLVGAAGLVTFAPKNIYLPDRLWQVSFDFAVPAFIHYLTLTGVYRSYIQTVCAGTSASMQNLSQDNFRDFTFALPDNQEQRVIADYLCTQTAKIDILIAKARQAIELMKERRTALISAAITGKIDVRGVYS